MDCEFLREVIACPACRGLLATAATIRCTSCGRIYPQESERWMDLSLAPADREVLDWQNRQVQCETWYTDLIKDPETAYHTLRVDIEPFAGILGDLRGDVLDVGGGIGIAREYLPRGGHYVSIDPSLAWIRTDWTVLADRFPSLRTLPCFVRGIAEALPFQAGSFDVVLSMWSMNHVKGQEQALAEMNRVLRPGGRALLVLEDMPARLADAFHRSFWSPRVGPGLARLKALASHSFTGRPFPIQDDHYPVNEVHLVRTFGSCFRETRRAWQGRYLYYAMDEKLPHR